MKKFIIVLVALLAIAAPVFASNVSVGAKGSFLLCQAFDVELAARFDLGERSYVSVGAGIFMEPGTIFAVTSDYCYRVLDRDFDIAVGGGLVAFLNVSGCYNIGVEPVVEFSYDFSGFPLTLFANVRIQELYHIDVTSSEPYYFLFMPYPSFSLGMLYRI